MNDLVPLFKALADASRIRILALLSGDKELSVEEIAAAVALTPATVSHHLQKLARVGLVSSTRLQYYTLFRFQQQPLLDALRGLADPPAPPPDHSEALARYDQKVLGDYLVDGKLKTIPAQRKKRDVILRFLAEQFDREQDYTEKEVSRRLGAFHEDFATLRRELIMGKLMAREDNIYRRL